MLKYFQVFLHLTGMWLPIPIGFLVGHYTCFYAGVVAVVVAWVAMAQLTKWVDDELLGLHDL